MTIAIEQVIKGVLHHGEEVRIRRYGPSHDPGNEHTIGVGVYTPDDGLRRVYVDPGEFAKAVNAAGIEGLTVTYVKPEPPEPDLSVPNLVIEGTWAGGALRFTRNGARGYSRLGAWINSIDSRVRTDDEMREWLKTNRFFKPTFIHPEKGR